MSTLDPQVLAFALVAALMTISPGADTVLVVRTSLRGGRRDGFATVLGISSGLYFHALLSAFVALVCVVGPTTLGSALNNWYGSVGVAVDTYAASAS